MESVLPWVILTAAAVPVYLFFEKQGSRCGRAAVKPLASLGFLGLALAVGALESTWGILLLVGLAFCAAGDLFLINRARGFFLAGLAAFLTGHFFYCAAFLIRGPAPVPVLIAAFLLTLPAALVWRWLQPHLADGMRTPVLAYLIVISLMLVLSIGVQSTGVPGRIVAGALAFYLSDLAVARDRFVSPGFGNRLWGLPLYYLGQLLIASCAG